MSLSPFKRRFLLGGTVLVLLLLALLAAMRIALVGLATGLVLRSAGADEISYRVTRATPWHLAVTDLRFRLGTQPMTIRQVTLDRSHWWSPSLGALKVEGLEAAVPLAALATLTATPPAAGPATRPPAAPPAAPLRVPLTGLSLNGRVRLQLAGRADEALTLKFAAHPDADNFWAGQAAVSGPGLALQTDVRYDLANAALAFDVPALTLDLQTWQSILQPVLPVASAGWQVAGRLTGAARGRFAGGKLTADGSVHLREGRAVGTSPALTAEGIAADLEFTDFPRLVTRPGTLRIDELTSGKLTVRQFNGRLALDGPDRIRVSHATMQALGGSVSTEPFVLVPSRAELNAVIAVDGIDIAQVLALTKDLPAQATGRIDGRFPLRLGRAGLEFGTGWLALKPGIAAEVRFNAQGLLTQGVSPDNPGYALLRKLETGLLRLKLTQLRLDLRPPDAPPGRTAQLHLEGAPADPTVKAPIVLDLNVNGPLEKLLNLGMNSRLNLGAGN